MGIKEDIKEGKRLTMRIPSVLHSQLLERCEKSGRSLNTEIIILLQAFIEAEEIVIPGDEQIKALEKNTNMKKEIPKNAQG